MTGDASAGATNSNEGSTENGDQDDYDEMIEAIDTAIAEARAKVESGRIYDAENEKVRVKWIRALAYTVNVRRQVTADRDLEELAKRLERLEHATDESANNVLEVES